ncbi:RNA ligase and tail fiber protein attachment catalyst [Pectobacterium bacteriophage PM2]|uniref:RNA ligase 1 n=1 Tax=Pectobacterium bacteriophage PM2 TaxID=1429794 RepID=A0A0A0Q0X0_9CAUD|nr:RNA ligase and tail fiber protein attachment catalyst [Pectobacterium bacteriophage PM2]AHY25208.1 RNA ligase 1 and tail fiber attachment catalyst [Pectobacterium bacteriophage PM2]
MKTLFNNLMTLCENSDGSNFFYKDFTSPFGTVFRIFNYNYASYTDWLRPDALECRGIMFEIDETGQPVRIAARPMEKFFNLNETPFTMNLDLSKTVLVTAKEDGSLISSFVDNNTLFMKSKGSIYSDQSAEALQFIIRQENAELMQKVKLMADAGYTCNFEYVSPTNRIVLDYKDKNLVLLNVRNIETGDYVPHQELFKDAVLRKYLVKAISINADEDFVEEIRAMEGIEGFIFELKDGLKFKLKTTWYSALHHTKDSINNNQRLFESILASASDDLKAMFAGDAYSINKIEIFEAIHRAYLTKSIAYIESVYSDNRGKARKDYVEKAQAYLNSKESAGLFSIVMKAYTAGIDYDTLIPQINKVFMKEHKSYIPTIYL